VGTFFIREEKLDGESSVILVDGYLDFDAAPGLRQSVLGQIEGGSRHLIIDLSATDFIDSTAIGVLVGALKRVRESDGSLAVVCTNENVRSVFEIVGLDDVIPVLYSREEAVSAITSAA